MSIVRSVFRLHQQLVVAPLRICSCSYSRPTSSSRSTGSRQSIPISTPFLTRSYASKKGKGSKKSAAVEEEDDDSPVEEVRGGKERGGSGGKKGKGKSFNDNFDSNDTVGGGVKEAFDLKALELTMEEAVDKLRIALKSVVGRVGRVSPDLLDNIRVESDGKRRPLAEFATVSVKDGKDLVVSVYEESNMKLVSEALYASPLSLTPQPISSTAFRVPIARPDWEKRQQLVRQASELCENARMSVRSTRGKGLKDSKSDLDAKLVNKEDGRNDVKVLDASTKKRTDEVDAIFEKAKKILMDE